VGQTHQAPAPSASSHEVVGIFEQRALDAKRLMLAHPGLGDIGFRLIDDLVRTLEQTDPDLHLARRYADQIRGRIFMEEASLTLSQASQALQDRERVVNIALKYLADEEFFRATLLLVRHAGLQKRVGLHVTSLLSRVKIWCREIDHPVESLQIDYRLYPLVNEDERPELLERMRQAVRELTPGWPRAKAQGRIYQLARQEQERNELLMGGNLTFASGDHVDRRRLVFRATMDPDDWHALLVHMFTGGRDPSNEECLRVIQAASQRPLPPGLVYSEHDSTRIRQAVAERLMPVLDDDSERLAKAHLAWFASGFEPPIPTSRTALAMIKRVKDSKVRNALLQQYIEICCDQNMVAHASNLAVDLSDEDPLAKVKVYTAISQTRQRIRAIQAERDKGMT